VIVGKRALPALAVTGDGADVERRVRLLARPRDIAIAFDSAAAPALEPARGRGCLTIAFAPSAAEWELAPPVDDPDVRQELIETLYHVLWELVHVFFEHRGLLRGRAPRRVHDAGAASFLYPFLAEQEGELDRVLADVRGSVLMKAGEIRELRAQTLRENGASLAAAAAATRAALDGGGTLLALGNGGSATAAIDVVADFTGSGRARGWAAIDLTEDPSIITAIANDIGPEAIFARQVIAYGRAGDVLLALSTSGGSGNVVDALAQARRQGIATIAFVGYDGGRIARDGLADHVVVTRSQRIPRIQEAQATAYHVLRDLVELAGGESA
jgi:D-sedoheptulose 7-phosphate isomerase